MTRNATGPKTAAGKAMSSQNARRHGLNAPPEEHLVTAWFNAIRNNGEDAMEEPNPDSPRQEAALRLAIAEARYHRARHKVATQETDPDSALQRATKLRDEIWTVFDRMPVKLIDGPADPYDLAYVNFAQLNNSNRCSQRSAKSVACIGVTWARHGRSARKP